MYLMAFSIISQEVNINRFSFSRSLSFISKIHLIVINFSILIKYKESLHPSTVIQEISNSRNLLKSSYF